MPLPGANVSESVFWWGEGRRDTEPPLVPPGSDPDPKCDAQPWADEV